MQAPLSLSEPLRLEALRRYRILDTQPEQDFDDLARIASQICATPIALITFVDETRQWFKATVGADLPATAGECAFCAHAILQSDLFVVTDARQDDRFADNPLVVASPHIRFYAGAPLITSEGHALGTLCVMDHVHRDLTALQRDALRVLCRQIIAQLEVRRTRDEWSRAVADGQAACEALRASEEFKTRMIEGSRDCIKTLDLDGRLLSMNAGGLEALEICDLSAYVNRSWIDFWTGDDRKAAAEAVAIARAGGVGRFLGYCPRSRTKTPRWWDVVVHAILDRDGKPERLLATSRDVTDLREASGALHTSEERFGTLFASAPIGVSINDADGKFLRVNRAFEALLGYSEAELGARSFKEVTYEADLPESRRVFAELVDGRRKEFRLEKRYRKSNGDLVWANTICSGVRDTTGRFLYTFAMVEDITERKRAEAELRAAHDDLERKVAERTAELGEANRSLANEVTERKQSEATLRALVDGVEAETGDRFFASLVRSLTTALGVHYAFVSELSPDRSRFATLAVWGRGAALPNFEITVAGTPCEDVLSGLMSHYPDRLQARFPADKGLAEWRAESYCGVPLLDSTGSVVGHMAIVHDEPMPDGSRALSIMRIFAARARAEIDRLRTEQALRASEDRLGRVLASAMDAIVTIDAQQRIEIFNEAAEKMFRCSASQAVGRSVEPFLSEGLRKALTAAVEAFQSGDGRPYLWAPDGLTARRLDGEEFPIEATISQATVSGRVLHTVILRDVNERRRAEMELRTLQLANVYLQEEIRTEHNFEEMIGVSRSIKRVFKGVETVAPTDSTVLIMGETGTGKELVARAIHNLSRRKARVLVKVNCAAMPAGLIESELFGHEKGAFTGALTRKIGRFELADGATIFLDEIGDLPLELQAKLLRVLQEGEYERLGNTKTMKVDVRVIAATNRDLHRMVADNRFRSDLYYRLNVFPIIMPPLRDRQEDIPLLVQYFAGRFGMKLGKPVGAISPGTMSALQTYGWPGNIRELEHVIERAMILSQGRDLDLTDLMPESTDAKARLASMPTLEEIERTHIVHVLDTTGWRVSGARGAASILGIKPTTLEARMKKLGITRQLRP